MFLKQEAIERKEKRARRFHFHGEESDGQRNLFLDKDIMKKGKRSRPLDLNPLIVSSSQTQLCVC